MKFGEKVKSLRERKGISQTALAKLIGVSDRTISGYETGGRFPQKREIYGKLEETLDTVPGYLLGESEEFILKSREGFGYRGEQGARALVSELSGLFAGGQMAEEDMDEMMLALQEAYIIAKRKNKKYTPHIYLKESE
jgi:transcriptional regulator with XRE-family HTH domain